MWSLLNLDGIKSSPSWRKLLTNVVYLTDIILETNTVNDVFKIKATDKKLMAYFNTRQSVYNAIELSVNIGLLKIVGSENRKKIYRFDLDNLKEFREVLNIDGIEGASDMQMSIYKQVSTNRPNVDVIYRTDISANIRTSNDIYLGTYSTSDKVKVIEPDYLFNALGKTYGQLEHLYKLMTFNNKMGTVKHQLKLGVTLYQNTNFLSELTLKEVTSGEPELDSCITVYDSDLVYTRSLNTQQFIWTPVVNIVEEFRTLPPKSVQKLLTELIYEGSEAVVSKLRKTKSGQLLINKYGDDHLSCELAMLRANLETAVGGVFFKRELGLHKAFVNNLAEVLLRKGGYIVDRVGCKFYTNASQAAVEKALNTAFEQYTETYLVKRRKDKEEKKNDI